ncbi:hypothetical protein PV392_29095 [Streptomyces sp. ME03-5709C]|nr:hypothetical protein [Streptomyces sp. ME03-5709C]
MEAIATMAPVLPVPALGLLKGLGETGTGTVVALPVTGSGRCPGARTGYAVDAGRFLRPRTVHGVPPIPRKGSAGRAYARIPGAGQLIGDAMSLIPIVAFK